MTISFRFKMLSCWLCNALRIFISLRAVNGNPTMSCSGVFSAIHLIATFCFVTRSLASTTLPYVPCPMSVIEPSKDDITSRITGGLYIILVVGRCRFGRREGVGIGGWGGLFLDRAGDAWVSVLPGTTYRSVKGDGVTGAAIVVGLVGCVGILRDSTPMAGWSAKPRVVGNCHWLMFVSLWT